MMKKIAFLLFMTCLIHEATAQKSYFQQRVDTRIWVTLHDGDHSLSALEEITYTNNSAQSLDKIYFHLWPNAYRSNRTALARQTLQNGKRGLYYAEPKDQGFIDSLAFSVNGKLVKWEILNEDTPDVAIVYLPQSLSPGQKIVISTPFHVKLPASFSRMGHIDQRYQITQWYPKPAVFDHQGWNPIPYLDQGEFYSEFGSFDVSITVPKNYVVGASGDLQTESEKVWLRNLAEENEREIGSRKDTSAKNEKVNLKVEVAKAKGKIAKKDTMPPSSSEWKTLRYTLDNVHDFAWFADKTFRVLRSEVTLPESKRSVETWLMYTPENAKVWEKAKPYIDSSIYYYSLWVGDYPYKVCTAVDGALSAGGGMEYPTITIISASSSPKELDIVIAHEVGHNWFYGILGSNERQHTWMDEGMNSYMEERYTQQRYGKGGSGMLGGLGDALKNVLPSNRGLEELVYFYEAGRGLDQSLGLRGDQFTNTNYGVLCYKKTAMNFRYLAAYLGQEEFDRIMHQYYREWQFKHPYPKDIEMVFERESKRNLDWFFGDLLNSAKTMDYSIQKKGQELVLKNKGEMASPVPVLIQTENGNETVQWLEGFSEGEKRLPLPSNHTGTIDPDAVTLDLNWGNNSTAKKVDLKFGLGFPKAGEKNLYFLPAIGNNANDGWLFGAVIHNGRIPASKLDFLVMPLYGNKSGKLAGHAHAYYHIRPLQKGVKDWSMGGMLRQYSFQNNRIPLSFTHFQPRITATFGERGGAFSTVSNTLSAVAFMNILDQYGLDSANQLVYDGKGRTLPIYRLEYRRKNAQPINPSSFSVDLEGNPDYWKLGLEWTQRISFEKKGRGADFRIYAGKMGIMTSDSFPFSKGYVANPGIRVLASSGADDYTLEQVQPCRSSETGLFAKNRNVRDAGLRIALPYNQFTGFNFTNDWAASIQFTSHLPLPVPVQVYADLAMFANAKSILPSQKSSLYVAGLQYEFLSFGRGKVFTVNLPLMYSSDFDLYFGRYNSVFRRVMFTARFDLMDLTRELR